jgi:hypothetical protein
MAQRCIERDLDYHNGIGVCILSDYGHEKFKTFHAFGHQLEDEAELDAVRDLLYTISKDEKIAPEQMARIKHPKVKQKLIEMICLKAIR